MLAERSTESTRLEGEEQGPTELEDHDEASDRSAAQSSSRLLLQRHADGDREIDEEREIDQEVDAEDGAGQPLPEPVRAKMEGSLGADFSGVRVAEGPEAEAQDADAFAQGEDVHMAPGKFQPDTTEGQELLGHELTHVVQQREGRASAPQNHGGVVTDPTLEREADDHGARAARGEPARAPVSAPAAPSHEGPRQARPSKLEKQRAEFSKKVAKARTKPLQRKRVQKLMARAQKLGMLLDLSGAVLDRIGLNGVDLRAVNLTGASLVGANLAHAHLGGLIRNADLSGADLSDAIVPPDLPTRAKVSSRTRLPDSVRLHVAKPSIAAGPDKPIAGTDADAKAIATAVKFLRYELEDGPRNAGEMRGHVAELLTQENAVAASYDDVRKAGEQGKQFTEKGGLLYLYVDAPASRYGPGDVVYREVKGSWKPHGVCRGDSGTSTIDQHYMNVNVRDPSTGQTVKVTEEQANASRAESFKGKVSLQSGHELAIGTEFIRDQQRRGEFQRTAKDGKLVSGDGQNLDTTQSHAGIAGLEGDTGGKQIYVMGRDGTLYSGDPTKESQQFLKAMGRFTNQGGPSTMGMANPTDKELDELPWRVTVFHHSSFLAGEDVQGAGEIQTVDGAVKMLSNSSGHYKPDARALMRVCDGLMAQGVDLTSAKIRFYSPSREMFEFYAGAWVASRGNVEQLKNKQGLNKEIGSRGTSALLRARAAGVKFPDKASEGLFVAWINASIDQLGTDEVDDEQAADSALAFLASYRAPKENDPPSGSSTVAQSTQAPSGGGQSGPSPATGASGSSDAQAPQTRARSGDVRIAPYAFQACVRAFRQVGAARDAGELASLAKKQGARAVTDDLAGEINAQAASLGNNTAWAVKRGLTALQASHASTPLAACDAMVGLLAQARVVAPLADAMVAGAGNYKTAASSAAIAIMRGLGEGRIPAAAFPDGMNVHASADWQRLGGDIAQQRMPMWLLNLCNEYKLPFG